MLIYSPPGAAKKIPVIDLAPAFEAHPEKRKSVAWEIHKACRETGFFYVANHGVPQDLIDSQFEQARRFFALPLDRRTAIHMKNSRPPRATPRWAGRSLTVRTSQVKKPRRT